MLADKLAAWEEARAKARRPPSRIAAHNAGGCTRALWYLAHGEATIPLTGAALARMEFGDLVEEHVASALVEAGTGFVRAGREDQVRLPGIGNVRCDGFLQMPDGDSLIVEIKSMGEYPFERAQRGEIDDKYLGQTECYIRAYDAERCLVLCVRLETVERCEVMVHRDDVRWTRVLASVARAREDALPDRPYQLEVKCSGCDGTGKTKVRGSEHAACGGSGAVKGGPLIPSFPCGYCNYRVACWGELEEVAAPYGKTRLRPASALADALKASLQEVK